MFNIYAYEKKLKEEEEENKRKLKEKKIEESRKSKLILNIFNTKNY
jgi:hypothetical protein